MVRAHNSGHAKKRKHTGCNTWSAQAGSAYRRGRAHGKLSPPHHLHKHLTNTLSSSGQRQDGIRGHKQNMPRNSGPHTADAPPLGKHLHQLTAGAETWLESTHAESRCRSPSTVKTNVGLSGSTAITVIPPPAPPPLQSRRFEDRDAIALELMIPLLTPAPHRKPFRLGQRVLWRRKKAKGLGWKQEKLQLQNTGHV